jgi:c-di-GMP-binding flagellar brake protein YcgR
MTKTMTESRKYIRYDLDEGSVAQVSLLLNDAKICTLRGLVINSSFGGCELLLISKYLITPHQKLEIKFLERSLADLGISKARVIWNKQLESDLYKLGVEYIDA